LGAEGVVGLDAVGLGDREIEFLRGLFDGGRDQFEAASFGAVGLSYDERDAVAGGNQRFERRDSEGRRAAEDEIERLNHLAIDSLSHRVIESLKTHLAIE
jgi:hypothetical protein